MLSSVGSTDAMLMGPDLLSPLRRSLGLQLIVGSVTAMSLSFVVLAPSRDDVWRLLAVAVSVVLLSAALRRVLRRRERASDLATIATLLLGLGATGLVTDGHRTAFSAIYVLLFVFIGCRLPSGSAVLLAAPAVGCWLVTNAPVDTLVLSRLPGAVAVWIVVGEALSARTARTTQERDTLRTMAHVDALTGLLNRHVLSQHLEQVKQGDALVMLDLDHFKAVNDTYGHSTGDAVLADLGRVVLSVMRSRDRALRYGGEEVLLLLPGAGTAGTDRALARLRTGWSASHPEITFSAGVYVSRGGDPAEELELADQALYAAKTSGRNRTMHYIAPVAPSPRAPMTVPLEERTSSGTFR